MRRLRAQLLGASLAAAAAAAAGARPLLLPPGSAAAAAATLTNAFHSWLTPHAVGDAALEPYAVREAALEPPRLAEPAGSDELALEWTGLAGATSYALLASDWWSGADGLSRTVYKGAALAAEVTERVMPGTPTSLQLVASDDSAELARSPAATFSAAESGACGNLADATIWRCADATLGYCLLRWHGGADALMPPQGQLGAPARRRGRVLAGLRRDGRHVHVDVRGQARPAVQRTLRRMLGPAARLRRRPLRAAVRLQPERQQVRGMHRAGVHAGSGAVPRHSQVGLGDVAGYWTHTQRGRLQCRYTQPASRPLMR